MITVSQETLKEALGIVGKVIPSRAALPVLTHVCLTLDGGLSIKGSDLEQTIVVEMDSMGSDELDICVPFPVFSKYVSELNPHHPIFLSQSETTLTLTQKDIKAEFGGLPGQEFPSIPVVPEKNVFLLDTDTIKWAFQSVLHAAATDESRPILTGVYIRSENDLLTFVTADGFRLALTDIKYKNVSPFTVIVPAKATRATLQVIPDEGNVYVSFDNHRIALCLPEDNGIKTTIYSQLIEGTYVNYKQIIPEKRPPIVVEKEELVGAIKRAAVFSHQETDSVTFFFSGTKMTIRGSASEYGGSEEIIEVDYSWRDIEVALNYAYTLDSLATCGDTINLEVVSGSRPVVVSSERDEHLCVLMPMHIRKA